jgi:hypothetical protein
MLEQIYLTLKELNKKKGTFMFSYTKQWLTKLVVQSSKPLKTPKNKKTQKK